MVSLPALGKAAWTDRVDNWRSADTDWVQDRLILRYAAGVTTMGEGTVYYDTTQKCLMVRNSATSSAVADHACIAAAANLRVYPGASDTTVTLGHMATPGSGLLISSTGALTVKPSIATVNDTVLIDASGVTVHTGLVTAKLTTDATTLHSNQPISAATFYGDVIATATTNAAALTATSGTFTSNVSVTGTLGVTGASTLGATTLTSTLTFGPTGRLGQHINLYGTAYGIGIQGSNLYFRSASAYKFYVGGTHTDVATASTLSVDVNSTDVTGTFTVTGNATVSGTLTGTGVISGVAGGYFGGASGGQVKVIDTSGAHPNDCYVEFFGNGTLAAPGTQSGYVGYPGVTELRMQNNLTNGGIKLITNGSGILQMQTGASGDFNVTTGAAGNIILNATGATGVITLNSGGSERGRVAGSLLWGKTAGGIATPGVELFEGGTIYSTTATNGTANLLLRHNTDAVAAFIQFIKSSGGIMSEFRQNGTDNGTTISNCTATPVSDYRWKDDLGSIPDALDRVMELQPKRLAWKANGKEFDGFIAHEATDIVPYLVYGEKDALQDNGDIEAQNFDYGGLTALLTAAIQELKGEVDALKSAA